MDPTIYQQHDPREIVFEFLSPLTEIENEGTDNIHTNNIKITSGFAVVDWKRLVGTQLNLTLEFGIWRNGLHSLSRIDAIAK